MLIHLSSADEQEGTEALQARLRGLYKHVIADERRGTRFLADRYLSGNESADQASLDKYLEEREGAVELILTDNLRSDTEFLKVYAIPREGLVVDMEEGTRVHWQPLLDRLIQHLPYHAD